MGNIIGKGTSKGDDQKLHIENFQGDSNIIGQNIQVYNNDIKPMERSYAEMKKELEMMQRKLDEFKSDQENEKERERERDKALKKILKEFEDLKNKKKEEFDKNDKILLELPERKIIDRKLIDDILKRRREWRRSSIKIDPKEKITLETEELDERLFELDKIKERLVENDRKERAKSYLKQHQDSLARFQEMKSKRILEARRNIEEQLKNNNED